MKCPVCVEKGLKSILNKEGYSTSTCMGGSSHYYDEEGDPHYHEVNTTSTGYWCSQGHQMTHKGKPKCPSCDYGESTWVIHKRTEGKE